jgi:hypothetical protein
MAGDSPVAVPQGERWLGSRALAGCWESRDAFSAPTNAYEPATPARDLDLIVFPYDLMNARRSALITSVCVVIKPCG